MFNNYSEETSLDLNALVIDHPAATFFMRMSGDALRAEGIFSGDLLVVDRSLTPKQNQLVVAIVADELTVMRLQQKEKALQIWGVVTYVIRKT
ncbi:MAG TPA: S24 family peptidase [Rhabdochlamydiaceae bacterium]|nr:S24 family peptidase [Rhabdochlamydiaceae bacterium]